MGKTEIALRIKNARQMAGLTQNDVAQQLGITYQAVSNFERGINRVESGLLNKMCKLYGISVASILDEDGSESSLDLRSIPGILSMPELCKIPLLGTIACGEPILAEGNVEDIISIPSHIHADFALRCQGDSMINARIHNGDIVYIRQQPEVENGEIAAVLVDGEATLKRVYLSPGKISLNPENPAYAPLIYVGDELGDIRILGKAVAFTSAL